MRTRNESLRSTGARSSRLAAGIRPGNREPARHEDFRSLQSPVATTTGEAHDFSSNTERRVSAKPKAR